MFLGEAAPAVIFGVLCFFYLTYRPTNAKWLTAEEKGWLGAEMQRETQTVVQHRTFSVLQTLINWRVLTNMQTGFATVIPHADGTVGMLLWGHYSDKKNERRWNLTGSCTVMGLRCIISGLLTGSYWSLLDLSLIAIGLYASNAHLFPLPAVFLTGPALASVIAWVNSVGIPGGSVSPPVMGYLRDLTGNFAGGLYALAGFAALAAIVAAVGVRETPARSSAAEPLAAAAG
jgi:ACS family tartrate transporter-like MFS transporter